LWSLTAKTSVCARAAKLLLDAGTLLAGRGGGGGGGGASSCVNVLRLLLAGTAVSYIHDTTGIAAVTAVEVTFSTTADTTIAASGCNVSVAHTQLQCQLPPGIGVFASTTVTVLGQAVTANVSSIAYAPPLVSSVAPSQWGTDSSLTVVVAGSGFGSAATSISAALLVTGETFCGGTLSAELPVTVRDDSTILGNVNLPFSGSIVPSWNVSVRVADQVSQVRTFSCACSCECPPHTWELVCVLPQLAGVCPVRSASIVCGVRGCGKDRKAVALLSCFSPAIACADPCALHHRT
jgi:hypothetical protein